MNEAVEVTTLERKSVAHWKLKKTLFSKATSTVYLARPKARGSPNTLENEFVVVKELVCLTLETPDEGHVQVENKNVFELQKEEGKDVKYEKSPEIKEFSARIKESDHSGTTSCSRYNPFQKLVKGFRKNDRPLKLTLESFTSWDAAMTEVEIMKAASVEAEEGKERFIVRLIEVLSFPYFIESGSHRTEVKLLWILMEHMYFGNLRTVYSYSPLLEVNPNRRRGLPKPILSSDLIRHVMAPIVLALKFLHDRNIVHRDIKQDNVLVSIFGVPKLTDFGSCILLKNGDDCVESGEVIGTPFYLAPEIMRNEPYNRSVDMWSFGSTMLALDYGGNAFCWDRERSWNQVKTQFKLIMLGNRSIEYRQKLLKENLLAFGNFEGSRTNQPPKENLADWQLMRKCAENLLQLDPKKRCSVDDLARDEFFEQEIKNWSMYGGKGSLNLQTSNEVNSNSFNSTERQGAEERFLASRRKLLLIANSSLKQLRYYKRLQLVLLTLISPVRLVLYFKKLMQRKLKRKKLDKTKEKARTRKD